MNKPNLLERNKNYKRVCFVATMTLLLCGVSGCGSDTSKGTTAETTSQQNTFVYAEETEEDLSGNTVMGMVDAIADNVITLSVGGGMKGNRDRSENSSEEGNMEPPTGELPEGMEEMPEGQGKGRGGNQPSGERPEKPSEAGEDSSQQSSDGEQPEMPDGEVPAGMEGKTATLTIGDESVLKKKGDDGESQQATLSDITQGSMLMITFDEDGNISEITVGDMTRGGKKDGGAENGMQPGGGQSSYSGEYTAVNTYEEDTEMEEESYVSSGTDENAILVKNGAKVTLKDITVKRESGDSTGGDDASFYGVGAAVLTTDGTTTISGADITTNAAGGAGIFSYGSGVTYVENTTISTTQDTSGGIHVAGGGSLYAWDLDVETAGESAAAIRSDRGGGKMVVDGGSYTSNGVGSPALYCTADIAVANATLTSTGSEAICMEGLNSIHLYDCNITGNMQDLSQNDTTWNVIVYQSMSGDSEVGNSTFQMSGGSLTAVNGGMFYTTNTESNVYLSDVDMTYAKDSEFFLMCTGNANERGWGTTGSNGADCTFTADAQAMEGKVVWDSISELDFYMINGSTLEGTFAQDESYAGDGGKGYASLYIDGTSTWIVTENATITNLCAEGEIVDADGKAVRVVGEDGTVYVEGDSKYQITVSSYSDKADVSGAAVAAAYSEYKVDKE